MELLGTWYKATYPVIMVYEISITCLKKQLKEKIKNILFFSTNCFHGKNGQNRKNLPGTKVWKKFPRDGSSAAGSIVANQQKVYIYILKKEIFLSKNSWPKKFDFLIVFETKIEFKKKICWFQLEKLTAPTFFNLKIFQILEKISDL